MKPKFAVALAIGIASAGACLLISCSTTSTTVVAPLEIPGAHYVGNKVCADCHAKIVREFPASPHARLVWKNVNAPGGIGCESCHGPGSKHVEAGGGAHFIINPHNEPEACFRCHLQTRAEFQLPFHHPVIEGHMN
ncbi:MAG: cytochrome c3 family protein, partial [Limisphaerales bacterium]